MKQRLGCQLYFAKSSGALPAHTLLEELDVRYSPVAVSIPDIRSMTLMFSRCVAGLSLVELRLQISPTFKLIPNACVKDRQPYVRSWNMV